MHRARGVARAVCADAEGGGHWENEVLGTIQGQYSAYVTRWLDTDEVRQLLPQIKMNSIPEILGRYPEGKLTYWIKTDYNGEPLYLYYYPPEFYVAYNGRWMHRLRGSEDAVQRLHEICLDACEQELADTIYW